MCLLSFLFFTSAPCALLRFIEERDRCLESEKQAQAIERIVPRVYREKSFTRRLNVPILGSLFVDKESRFANSYSFTFHQGLTKGRGKQAKPDRRGKSVVTEVDYRTGVGENIAKGSISDSSSTVNSRNSILFLEVL